ncbi:acyltransferase [Acidithiobacillus caldus]|nr:acyltransferase [Acidithiobacillus caldus]
MAFLGFAAVAYGSEGSVSPSYGDGATSNAVAMQRIAQNRQVAPEPGYAWTKPYCLRYRSAHPDLLILGDSIFDGWSGYLLHVFPRALVDARVGRQFSSAIPIYRRLLAYPGVRSIRTVVVELGTNGPVTPEQVAQFMRLAGPNRRVVFIVPEVPRPWATEVQDLYASLPQAYPNVRLEYWNRIASLPDGQENGSYFWGDGVHPNWNGIRALVGGLQAVLEQDR